MSTPRQAKLRVVLAILSCLYRVCAVEQTFGGDGVDRLGNRTYDCGANSLFILSNILSDGPPLSYARCLELLPVRPDGNSLKEVQAAVSAINLSGQTVEIQPRELAGLHAPAIALWFPAVAKNAAIGHFFVVRPLRAGRVQVMDFMEGHPVAMDVSQLVVNLTAMRITKMFLVLAGSKDLSLDEMLVQIATPATTQSPENEEDAGIVKIDDGLTSPIRWDFREAYEGDHLHHDFVFENRTGRTLQVREAKASCGCTSITTDRDTIPANGRVRLSTAISLEGKLPQFRSDGVLLFSDKSIPAIQMQMTGKVLPRWISTPASLDIGDVSPDSNAIERDVFVRPSVRSADNPQIVSVNSSSAEVSVLLDSGSDEPSGGYKIHVSMDPRALAGVINSTIFMHIAGQNLPVEICHVSAHVVADSIVSPAMGLLQLKDHQWALLQPISIRGLGGHTIRSIEVSGSGPSTVGSYVCSKSASSGDFVIESIVKLDSPQPPSGRIVAKVEMADGKVEYREVAIVAVPSS